MSDHNDILFDLLYELKPRTLLHLTLAYFHLDTTILRAVSNVNCTLDLVNEGLFEMNYWLFKTPIRRSDVQLVTRSPKNYDMYSRYTFRKSELQLFRALGKCKEFVFWNMWATREVFQAIAEIGTWVMLDQVKIVKQGQQLEEGIIMKWNDWFGSEDFEKLLGVCLLQIVVTIEDWYKTTRVIKSTHKYCYKLYKLYGRKHIRAVALFSTIIF